MNRRIRKVFNFFAFNLLFFALYLNFIHKDNNTLPPVPPASPTATVNTTVLANNPDQYAQNGTAHHNGTKATSINGNALKQSFN